MQKPNLHKEIEKKPSKLEIRTDIISKQNKPIHSLMSASITANVGFQSTVIPR